MSYEAEQLRIEASCDCGVADFTATGDPTWARQALAHWLQTHKRHGVHIQTQRLVRLPPSVERVEVRVRRVDDR